MRNYDIAAFIWPSYTGDEPRTRIFWPEGYGEWQTVRNAMANAGEKADVVIMDPPRAGSDERFMSSVVTLSPKRVVYVSCNPETQKRDLFELIKGGYKVKKIQPVDMFPHTNHVETVVLLTRK